MYSYAIIGRGSKYKINVNISDNKIDQEESESDNSLLQQR